MQRFLVYAILIAAVVYLVLKWTRSQGNKGCGSGDCNCH